MNEHIKEFEKSLRNYWLCEGRDRHVGEDLLTYLRNPQARINEVQFRNQLADAILNKVYSVNEYERLTDLDFESKEDVAADLAELWKQLFGADPIEKR